MYNELVNILAYENNDFLKIDRVKKLALYAYIKNFISNGSIMRLRQEIFDVQTGFDEDKPLAQILVQELLNHLQQKDVESLLECLKDYELPLWLTVHFDDLFDALPSVQLMDRYLYYISSDHVLKKIDTEGDWEWDEEFIELPLRYKKILGVDHKKGVLYLQTDNLYKCYVAFETKTKQFVFYKGEKWIGQSASDEGVLVIIDEKHRIICKTEQSRSVIKKASCFEQYSMEGDLLKVMPIRGMPLFFTPYYMTLDGKRQEFSDQQITKFFWQILHGIFVSIYGPFDEEETIDEKEMTVESLFQYLESKPFDERTENLSQTLLLLLPCLKKNILYTLFVLFEANTRYEEYLSGEIITKRLRERIESLDEEGFLRKCTVSSLRVRLLSDVYWTYEKLSEIEDAYYEELNFVGIFRLKTSRLKDDFLAMERIPRSKGMFVGSLIVMPTHLTKETGTVSYNIDNGRTEISYHRRLTEKQVEKLCNFFNLYQNEMVINICNDNEKKEDAHE